jgi:hypothetical protein
MMGELEEWGKALGNLFSSGGTSTDSSKSSKSSSSSKSDDKSDDDSDYDYRDAHGVGPPEEDD